MFTREVTLEVILPANIEKSFAAMVNWPAQSDWMLGTKVWLSAGDGQSVGSEITALTGIGSKLGLLDTMRITNWEPPKLVEVLHVGKILKGVGIFKLEPISDNQTKFIWYESVWLPFGIFGLFGWWLIKPGFVYGVRKSLKKFSSTL